jgi:CRP-like cAMP-binding protein
MALDHLEHSSEWISSAHPILREGEAEEMVLPLLDGLAYQHKDLRGGRRQIIAVLLPGDLCSGYGRRTSPMDYGVRALTQVRIARIPKESFDRILACHGAIADAMATAAVVEEAVLRAWLVNLGQRDARERVAHLICELARRMADCGLLLIHGGFDLPLTQQELGSALGLTNVHVNRILRRLRDEDLMDIQRGVVRIQDLERLQRVADFDPAYLSS